jgi:hypothetical protein
MRYGMTIRSLPQLGFVQSLKSSLTRESELSSNAGRTGTTVGKTSGAQMAVCSRKD